MNGKILEIMIDLIVPRRLEDRSDRYKRVIYKKIQDYIKYRVFIIMKERIKQILKETYDQQQLRSICTKISTGSNSSTREFMNELRSELNQMTLTPKIKNQLNNVFNHFNRDTNQVEDGVPTVGGLKGATGDSQSDEGDMYLTQIQDIICSGYLEELD